VTGHRPGALERAELVLADWRESRRRLAEVETRMVAVLDELELTGLVTSIDGLTALGAAAILAETGDPTRFGSPRAVVKHAGLVLAARFTHLTTRGHNRLTRQQARAACAAALLRWLHVIVTGRVRWDPAIAAGGRPLDLVA
jgi:transposase